jgi:NTP pyrophosphatase (non-canonical NTP hydrolase)
MNITHEREVKDGIKDIHKVYLINQLRDFCYKESFDAGWHTDLNTGELKERNKGEMLALIHSEVSEMLEGERKDLMDDKLPHRKMVEVEAADVIIRVLDYCGRWNLDVGGAFVEKVEFNRNRSDFKKENRQKEGGKKF